MYLMFYFILFYFILFLANGIPITKYKGRVLYILNFAFVVMHVYINFAEFASNYTVPT
jgi:hypothetical protein